MWNGDGICDDGGPNVITVYVLVRTALAMDPRYDNDNDGFYDDEGVGPQAQPSNDCDDSDASINPDTTDYDNDGIDQDCDGSDFVDEKCEDACVSSSGVD